MAAIGNHPPQLASRRRRLGSLFYDALVVLALAVFLVLLPATVLSSLTQRVPSPGLLRVCLFILLGVYFVWCWFKAGQTLAMKTWRLRVVDAETQGRLRLLQAVVRYGMAWLCWPTGLALLWSFLDNDQQFLHDRLAGTRILYEPK